MDELTTEQEQQILEDLTALDWTRDLDTRSTQVISERLDCSLEDASLILQRLREAKITAVSESGGTPAANRALDSYGWKWVVMRTR
jgi:hypothetical protein